MRRSSLITILVLLCLISTAFAAKTTYVKSPQTDPTKCSGSLTEEEKAGIYYDGDLEPLYFEGIYYNDENREEWQPPNRYQTCGDPNAPFLSIKNSHKYDDYVQYDDPLVRQKAMAIASKFPGSYSVEQVNAIYDEMKKNFRYVNDPVNGDVIPASEILRNGEVAGCLGVGDCEDYAILMCSLIEAIGGRCRIVHTENHAYPEVQIDSGRRCWWQIAEEDNLKFGERGCIISFHLNWITKEYWLPLDFGDHPGSLPKCSGIEDSISYIGPESKVPIHGILDMNIPERYTG